MPKLSELMKHVSLHSIDKIPQLENDERLIIFYEDDEDDFDCNRSVSIAMTVLQLDAILCYTKREVDCVVKMKTVEIYT